MNLTACSTWASCPRFAALRAYCRKQRQTLCFSATLEASVAGLVNDYMRSPVRVALGSTSKPVETVELQAFEVPAADKSDVLRRLLYDEKGQTLIFARTKRGTERLAKNLIRDGFSAAMIHGDRSQSQRVNALNGFDKGQYKVLVATDVASRGIHVDNVAHVINYDLPQICRGLHPSRWPYRPRGIEGTRFDAGVGRRDRRVAGH